MGYRGALGELDFMSLADFRAGMGGNQHNGDTSLQNMRKVCGGKGPLTRLQNRCKETSVPKDDQGVNFYVVS